MVVAALLTATACHVSAPASKSVSPVTGFTILSDQRSYSFSPSFTILFNESDPDMALKPLNLPNLAYNVLTWKVADSSKADFVPKNITSDVAGDGFDDRILRRKVERRTANIYHAGEEIKISAESSRESGDTVHYTFPANPRFVLNAYIIKSKKPYPELSFKLTPSVPGFFSVGYTGAPVISKNSAAEIWQPLIWQEKRIPQDAYLTPSFMATLPTTFVNDGINTVGVLAASKEIPFQPLPLLTNSRFGISVLNEEDNLQPRIYAPMPGGYLSEMKPGQSFKFTVHLVVESGSINHTYQKLSQTVYGFRDYRSNAISTLNSTLDNIIDYSLSDYTWYVDSLKGYAYSTDVPGAVKNVSSLNPLELAILRDDPVMFEKRAYPQIEYMMSREKFLFSLDSTQKIQNPSRRLKGPVAPLSELGALYSVLGKQNPFFLTLMKKEYNNNRIRNLDVKEDGNNWINAIHLFRATGDKAYLQSAIEKAKEYIKQRVYSKQTAFNDPFAGGFFFWPAYTNRWIELSQLYELTGDTTFLNAAVEGARNYTMFTWMVPAVPDSLVTVNKDGKAPVYWYLRSKGHKQVYYPEEKVPAWRLSETGLTPESSGTSSGHRAIFMANYAPWMLRVAHYAKDSFLLNVAKAAVIGRYRNFPGYHINTARTTAYEKVDFPFLKHKEQSVNSFHYNHILPMASMLVDYLVTDAQIRSSGAIDFPAEYIEGYAYLQSKMYGAHKGKFYDENAVQLWMPKALVHSENIELNYISAKKDDKLFIAFTNQSPASVSSAIRLNDSLVTLSASSRIAVWKNNKWETLTTGQSKNFNVTVAGNGITALRIEQVTFRTGFQEQILAPGKEQQMDYKEISIGNAKAMLLKLGSYAKRLYVYLEDDDTKYKKVSLTYQNAAGKSVVIQDTVYPFEFTIPVDENKITFGLSVTDHHGAEKKTENITLGQ
jgi:hypothetical protein